MMVMKQYQNFRKSKLGTRKKKILLLVMVPVLVAVALLAHLMVFLTFSPGDGTVQKVVEIKRGASLRKIAADLETAGLVTSARMFAFYGQLSGASGKIQAGTYEFDDAMSPQYIMRKMISGDVMVLYFTVPEGYSIYQIAELLEQQGFFKKEGFLRQCFNKELLDDLGIKAASVEGYLYPSTYQMPREMDEAGLIRIMAEQFFSIYSRNFERQVKARKMRLHEVLTLASIIEKEAVVPYERPLIASVFTNRLKRGMRLQSDPTAIYGQRAFGAKVRGKDVRNNSNYNTYRINGLPPGPIGNPSSEAIEAVLNPAKTDYLYFVAKKNGTHHFSTNLAEHNRAVNLYLKSPASARSRRNAAEIHNDAPHLSRRR